MKKMILTCFILFGVFLLFQSCDKDEDIIFPQDKLQFSKVVYVKLDTFFANSCNPCAFNLSKTIVVGQNKVLKIESINHSSPLNIDEIEIIFDNYSLDKTRDIESNYFPIWVPTGSYNLEIRGSGIPLNSLQLTAILSGIEYDIIP